MVISMSHSLHRANHTSSSNVCALQGEAVIGLQYDSDMTEADANYLRQWREFRGLSQDELAAAIDTTKFALCKLLLTLCLPCAN